MARTTSALWLALALATPSFALAGPGNGAPTTAAPLSDSDRDVLIHHHHVNRMEIEMGRLAMQRGGPAAKKYAATLIRDHQRADRTAVALARAHDLDLERAMPRGAMHDAHLATMTRLRTLDGAGFEREFFMAMIDGHGIELNYLTTATADAEDAKLKAHLAKVRPVVERHLNEARTLLAQLHSRQPAGTTSPTPPPPSAPPAGGR